MIFTGVRFRRQEIGQLRKVEESFRNILCAGLCEYSAPHFSVCQIQVRSLLGYEHIMITSCIFLAHRLKSIMENMAAPITSGYQHFGTKNF